MAVLSYPGPLEQSADLLVALEHNCDCPKNESGETIGVCSAHNMLHVQKSIGFLAFGKFLSKRLLEEEWKN